jgi:hypothetical protein
MIELVNSGVSPYKCSKGHKFKNRFCTYKNAIIPVMILHQNRTTKILQIRTAFGESNLVAAATAICKNAAATTSAASNLNNFNEMAS